MILNASGRTDIVAFYSEWFMNRYKEGFVDVRNPFYPKSISRIYFSDVEAIVFCTKNPIPMVDKLAGINKPIIFQVTLTPYKSDIEPNVVSKEKVIEAIKKVSSIVGIDNVYVRYDPILLNKNYTIEYHKKAFERMCSLLDGYVKHIIVSFVDDYKNVRNNSEALDLREFKDEDYHEIGMNLSNSARMHNMSVQTCSEGIRLIQYGFLNSDCVTKEMAFKLTGRSNFKKWNARNNENCSCIEMADIGVYNSCSHFCKYCYANFDEKKVLENRSKHDKHSSLLIGYLADDDIIKVRK